MARESPQEALLLLLMPVGLLHGTAPAVDGIDRSARCVRPLLMGLLIWLLVNFPGLEIDELGVAHVLKHQRLLAVANDHPIALPDQHVRHAHLLDRTSCATS